MFPPSSARRATFLAGLAALLGFGGGAAAWALLGLIDLITSIAVFGELSFDPPTYEAIDPGARLVIVAVIGALLISLLAKWAPVIRGHGIPEAMEAILIRQSRIAPRTALAKPLSAALAIGTSAPFGAEGPIIVTGGSLGSLLGQLVPVSAAERKILLASGAAAGMSATFGAPLASVVLAVELLLFEFSARALLPLVIASSVAAGMHEAFIGQGPLFSVPFHESPQLQDLPSFAALGLACGLFALLVSKGLFAVEAGYRRLPVGQFWHPIIGAVGFALVGLVVPRALGVGYDAINDVLSGQLALTAAASLLAAKLLAWWLALGSGTSGGTLAPILLMGASFGTLVGGGLNAALPDANVALGTFAVVAMGATFGAASRASFASIVFVFELTRDYQLVVPLMLATILADLVFRSLSEQSIMTEKLSRRGLRVGQHLSVDPFTVTPVESIMSTPVERLDAHTTVGAARQRFLNGGHGAYPIVDPDDRVLGIVARSDLMVDGLDYHRPVLEVGSRTVVSVRPHDTAIAALHLMIDAQVDHIPVLQDETLIGICTRADLMKVRREQRSHEDLEPPGTKASPRRRRPSIPDRQDS